MDVPGSVLYKIDIGCWTQTNEGGYLLKIAKRVFWFRFSIKLAQDATHTYTLTKKKREREIILLPSKLLGYLAVKQCDKISNNV